MTQQVQTAAMPLRGQWTAGQEQAAVLLLCGQWAVGDAMRVGGSIVVVRQRTVDTMTRAGGGYVVAWTGDNKTRAGGGDVVVRVVVS